MDVVFRFLSLPDSPRFVQLPPLSHSPCDSSHPSSLFPRSSLRKKKGKKKETNRGWCSQTPGAAQQPGQKREGTAAHPAPRLPAAGSWSSSSQPGPHIPLGSAELPLPLPAAPWPSSQTCPRPGGSLGSVCTKPCWDAGMDQPHISTSRI